MKNVVIFLIFLMCACGGSIPLTFIFNANGSSISVLKHNVNCENNCTVSILIRNASKMTCSRVYIDVEYYDPNGRYILTSPSNVIDILKPNDTITLVTKAVISRTEPPSMVKAIIKHSKRK